MTPQHAQAGQNEAAVPSVIPSAIPSATSHDDDSLAVLTTRTPHTRGSAHDNKAGDAETRRQLWRPPAGHNTQKESQTGRLERGALGRTMGCIPPQRGVGAGYALTIRAANSLDTASLVCINYRQPFDTLNLLFTLTT